MTKRGSGPKRAKPKPSAGPSKSIFHHGDSDHAMEDVSESDPAEETNEPPVLSPEQVAALKAGRAAGLADRVANLQAQLDVGRAAVHAKFDLKRAEEEWRVQNPGQADVPAGELEKRALKLKQAREQEQVPDTRGVWQRAMEEEMMEEETMEESRLQRTAEDIEKPTKAAEEIEKVEEVTSSTGKQIKKARRRSRTRRGARRTTARTSTPEAPGDPRRPSTFIDIKSNEQKLAAYMGFSDVADMRTLTVSWPMLKAVVANDYIAQNLSKKAAFTLLYDAEKQFQDIDNDAAATTWPLLPTDANTESQNKKSRRLACILLTLEKDFRTMAALESPENVAWQNVQREKFAARFPDLHVPDITYVDPADPDSMDDSTPLLMPIVHPPAMGPHPGEHRLESLNRCWNSIRYFRHTVQAAVWSTRFSDAGVRQSYAVDVSYVPTWMQPARKTIPDQIRKTAEVALADALPAKEFSIVWDRNEPFEGKEEVDGALARARQANIRIPSDRQQLAMDPRLFESGASFRDLIRRQFNCQELGIDIRNLELRYKDSTPPKGERVKDMLRDAWDDCRSVFGDSHTSEMVFSVLFEARDDADEEIWETLEPPPALSSFFDISSGDVAINTDVLAETARIAFDESITSDLQQHSTAQDTGTLDSSQQTTLSPAAAAAAAPVTDEHLHRALGHGSAGADIGAAPDPLLKFPTEKDKEAMIAYYGGYDVTSEEQRRIWQRKIMQQVSDSSRAATIKADKFPKGLLDKEQERAIEEARFLGQHMASAVEGDSEDDAKVGGETTASLKQQRDDGTQYLTMKTAFSGTPAQVGPPLDVCLRLLDCESLEDGRYRSNLLKKVTSTTFFDYQITGAVGTFLKLYGRIDAKKLIAATSQLEDVCIHGGILADDVGFGKTKQMLLVAFLHSIQQDETDKETGQPLFRPILLLLLPALINQWLEEIRTHWPFFEVIVSYDDHEFKDSLALSSLSHTAMSEFPSLDQVPLNLKLVFDPKQPRSARVIIVSSYQTHKARTGRKIEKKIPGVRFTPPRYKKGQEIWRKKPQTNVVWETGHEGVYSLLLADECQKLRNFSTGLWSVIYRHSFRKTLLVTATPFFNTIKDILALVCLLWPAAEQQLQKHVEKHPEDAGWLAKIHKDKDDLLTSIAQLPSTSALRLSVLQPKHLHKVVHTLDDIHKNVSLALKPVLDMIMIRSPASVLPVTTGSPIPIRGLFKQITRKTATIDWRADEKLEYQLWHRVAAREFVAQMMGRDTTSAPLPDKPVSVSQPNAFSMSVGPLRKLAMACFAVKMARLNAIMEQMKANTHVATLNKWREQGREADFIHELTRGKGEKKAETAENLIEYLCHGSPVARLVFQELRTIKAIEPVDKKLHRSHQKLLIGESTPANALYLMMLLRSALIDARVLHAGLSNKGKADMVDLFNDPESSLRVLILMYDVGAVGLNLHLACNRVLIASVARSFSAEEQLAGRVTRITFEFPVTVVRRETPNSHDGYRAALQADKATVQLAANAHDPSIRKLLVKLLNANQAEVDRAHASTLGETILSLMEQRQKMLKEVAQAQSRQKKGRKQDFKAVLTVTKKGKKVSKIEPEELDLSSKVLPAKRIRKPVIRYTDVDYHPEEGTLLPAEEREAARRLALLEECVICFGKIEYEDQLVCAGCGDIFHQACQGIEDIRDEFRCRDCLEDDDGSKREGTKSVSGAASAGRVKHKSADVVMSDDENDEEEEEEEEEEVMIDSDDDTFIASDDDQRNSDEEYEDEGDRVSDEEDDDSSDGNVSNASSNVDMAAIVGDEDEDDTLLLKRGEAIEFLIEQQPDDATRHQCALMALPANKVWSEKDLEKEFYLKLALLLLYNAIQGKSGLAYAKAIHINYIAFPTQAITRMQKQLQVGDDRQRDIKKHLGLTSTKDKDKRKVEQ